LGSPQGDSHLASLIKNRHHSFVLSFNVALPGRPLMERKELPQAVANIIEEERNPFLFALLGVSLSTFVQRDRRIKA
jgi:hypothetical protein